MDILRAFKSLVIDFLDQINKLVKALKSWATKRNWIEELVSETKGKKKSPSLLKAGSDEYQNYQTYLNPTQENSMRRVSPLPNYKPKQATFETPKAQGINTSVLSSGSPEALNHKLENMLHQKKFNEVLSLLKSSRGLCEVRSSVLGLFLDLLQESNNLNQAYELMKLLISRSSLRALR